MIIITQDIFCRIQTIVKCREWRNPAYPPLSSWIYVYSLYRLWEIKVFTFNAMFFYASARTEQIDVDLLLFSPDLICVFLFPLILILSIVIFFTERRINSGRVLGLNLIGNIQEPTINKNNSIFQHNRDSTSTLLYFLCLHLHNSCIAKI